MQEGKVDEWTYRWLRIDEVVLAVGHHVSMDPDMLILRVRMAN
jgi:hypothetical protein